MSIKCNNIDDCGYPDCKCDDAKTEAVKDSRPEVAIQVQFWVTNGRIYHNILAPADVAPGYYKATLMPVEAPKLPKDGEWSINKRSAI